MFHGGAHGYVLAQVLGLDYENDEERDFMRHLINVGLAEPLRHDHVRLHPALAPYLSNELTAERRESAVSAVSAAMSQLTSHLYQQQFKDAQPAAELTLLELPNLLAALEHRFAAVALDNQPHRASGRFTASRDGSQRQMTTADQEPGASAQRLIEAQEQQATALESVIDMATRLEGLLQNLGRAHALRAAESIRVQAADVYKELIEIDQKRGDLRDVATNKGQLGTVRLLHRRYAEALAAWDEARQTFEQLGEPGSVAKAWHQIGYVHQESGQFEAAEHAY